MVQATFVGSGDDGRTDIAASSAASSALTSAGDRQRRQAATTVDSKDDVMRGMWGCGEYVMIRSCAG